MLTHWTSRSVDKSLASLILLIFSHDAAFHHSSITARELSVQQDSY